MGSLKDYGLVSGLCVYVHVCMSEQVQVCVYEHAFLGTAVRRCMRVCAQVHVCFWQVQWGCLPDCVHICVPGLCVGVYVQACVLDCSWLGAWVCRLGPVSALGWTSGWLCAHGEMLGCPQWDPRLVILGYFCPPSPSQVDGGLRESSQPWRCCRG